MFAYSVRSLQPAVRRIASSLAVSPLASASATRFVSTTASMRVTVKPATTAAPRVRATKSATASTANSITPASTSEAAAASPVVDPETPTETLPPLPDAPEATYNPDAPPVDWSSSFHGLSTTAFSAESARILMAPIEPDDIEMKPDGIIYLPEIKYRRILNLAFGPGGWGLAPRGELKVGDKVVSREYALVVKGRFVGQARGECGYFGGDDGVTTAAEGCKSNALMRCCKDLGIASELWDPRFIRRFKEKYCKEVWVEHVATKKRRQIWMRNDCPPTYPYTMVKR